AARRASGPGPQEPVRQLAAATGAEGRSGGDFGPAAGFGGDRGALLRTVRGARRRQLRRGIGGFLRSAFFLGIRALPGVPGTGAEDGGPGSRRGAVATIARDGGGDSGAAGGRSTDPLRLRTW